MLERTSFGIVASHPLLVMKIKEDTNEFTQATQAKHLTSVGFVRRHFLVMDIAKHMNEFTKAKNHTSVCIVRRHFLVMDTAKNTNEFT